MVTLLVFIMAFFGGSFWPEKKLLDTKGPFNGNVFKNLARYTVYIITNHVNFLLFDSADMRPLKCQVSFILSIFVLI